MFIERNPNEPPQPNAAGWAVPGVPFDRPDGGGDSPRFSAGLEQALALAEAAAEQLAALAANQFAQDSSKNLIAAERTLRAIEDRLHTARLAMLPKIDTDGSWRHDYLSVANFGTWLAQHDDISRSSANLEIRQAKQLRDELPTTQARALAGQTSGEQVKIMCTVAATSQARKTALQNPVQGWEPAPDNSARNCGNSECRGCCECAACGRNLEIYEKGDSGSNGNSDAGADNNADSCNGNCCVDCKYADQTDSKIDQASGNITEDATPTGETYLLDMAEALPLYQFRRLAKRFAHVADPESDERGYKQALEREYFDITQTLGGFHISGFLAEEHGQQVKIAIDNLVNSTLVADGDIVAARATRTNAQRRAQALADLAQLAMDTGMLGSGAIERRELTITISHTELEKITSTPHGCPTSRQINITELLDPTTDFPTYTGGHDPVPQTVLRRWLCDCNLRRIIFGPDGQILDVGRTQRTVPPHLRAAVIARDKHCVYPGCDQPPGRCEVHHALQHWADSGNTSTENSALLCWHHHTHIDDNGIIMRWKPQTRTWQFTTKQGTPITT